MALFVAVITGMWEINELEAQNCDNDFVIKIT